MSLFRKKNSFLSFVKIVGVFLLVVGLQMDGARGFSSVQRYFARGPSQLIHGSSSSSSSSSRTHHLKVSTSTVEEPEIGFDRSCALSEEEVAPIIRLEGSSGEKVINLFGILCIMVTLITCPIWSLAMYVVNAVCSSNEELDPNRSFYDYTGKIWARTWLTLANSYPTISGDLSSLQEGTGPYLYVANHASWLDIPILCTVLDPVFKFIAKGELLSTPCIGQQLSGGNHILIDREDRRSQLRTFKEGVNWLKSGVSLMAFPEGKRSHDGRLMEFKGGVFSMAAKSNVPIVPISISNTHAVMPSNSIFPVQSGAGKLHVHVHSPIDIDGRPESEIASLVREKLLSKMPLDQHPLPSIQDEILKNDGPVLTKENENEQPSSATSSEDLKKVSS